MLRSAAIRPSWLLRPPCKPINDALRNVALNRTINHRPRKQPSPPPHAAGLYGPSVLEDAHSPIEKIHVHRAEILDRGVVRCDVCKHVGTVSVVRPSTQ